MQTDDATRLQHAATWLLVVNEVIMMLPQISVEFAAYAGDFVQLASGIELNTLSSMTFLRGWALQMSLEVNPVKTECVLFTKRYKVPPFSPRICLI